MKSLGLGRYVLSTCVAVVMLTGCGRSQPPIVTPGAMPQPSAMSAIPKEVTGLRVQHGRLAPLSAKRGIYVSEFFLTSKNIIGFWRSGRGPICYESTGSNVGDLSADSKGNLIVPNGSSGVLIYQGPRMCGPLLGTIPDPYGPAISAAAVNALNGTIVVGEFGDSGGSVATCTLSKLSCRLLKSPHMSDVASVAMDASGNCYADAYDTSGGAGLWYYAGCGGKGTELTSANGFSEPYLGGLSVDDKGHVVVLSLLNSSSSMPSTVTVYSGCGTGTCKVVGGPFELQGESIYGHLNLQNTQWVTADISDGTIEIYAYTGHGTGLTYLYGLGGFSCATNDCESAAFSPGSPK